MKKWLKKLKSNTGYTLAELSISTSIIAMLAVGGLAIMQKKNAADSIKETEEKLLKIQSAIQGFVRKNDYLPCPSGPALPESNTLFGKSVAYNTTLKVCDNDAANDGVGDSDINTVGGTTAADILTNSTGAVPVRTLNLPDDMAYDGWERKFTFRIADGAGKQSDFEDETFVGDIAIVTRQGTHKTNINDPAPYNDGAVYVIISHGSNGKDTAWRKNSVTAPSQATGVEKTNTDHSRKVYVQDRRTESFDDMVAYALKDQLIQPKNIASPIQITEQICENARSIVSNGSSHSDLTSFAADANGSQARASLIYEDAKRIEVMCDNEPAAAANPSKLTGLTLWLDANDSSTLFGNNNCSSSPDPANNAAIGCWKDKSGNGFNATEATNKPDYKTGILNNKPVIRFNGTNDVLTLSSNITDTVLTAFIVASKASTGSGYRTAIRLNRFQLLGRDTAVNQWGVWEQNAVLSGQTLNTTAQIMAATQKAFNNVDLATNGASINITSGTGLPNSSATSHIGAVSTSSQFMDGDIAEIVIYNRALSTSERAKIEAYLSDKWNIALASSTTNYCSEGLTWQKTADYPEGTCACPTGQVQISSLESYDACTYDTKTSFSGCVTPNTEPTYSSPPSSAGQVLWLDANDCTTISLASGGTVTKWADKSGRGYDVSQSTSGYRPVYTTNVLNSKPIIRFDGTDDVLTNTSFMNFTNITMIGVGKYNSGDTTQAIAEVSTNTTNRGALLFYETADSKFRSWDGTMDSTVYTETLPVTHIFSGVSDGTNDYYYVDGSLKQSVASGTLTSTTDRVHIGQLVSATTYAMKGDIGEVLVYDRALTNSERESVESYLASKWDIDRIPTDISSLQVWLDASDLNTVYQDTGCSTTKASHDGVVGCWKNKKSGGGNNAAQNAGGSQPKLKKYALNNLPVVVFDGTDDYYDIDLTSLVGSPLTIFAVDIRGSNKVSNYFVGTGPGANNNSLNYGWRDNTSQFTMDFWNSGVNSSAAPAFVANTPAFSRARFSSSAGKNVKVVVNSTSYTNSSAGQTTALAAAANGRIGWGANNQAAFQYNGSIAELIIYSAYLTDAQCKSIESYLASKWGITIP